MKKNKVLNNLIANALKISYQNGKLNQKKADQIVKNFKKLETSQAIYCLTRFSKAIKNEQDKKTLKIDSATKLTKSEVDDILKEVKKAHLIEIITTNVDSSLHGGVKVQIGDYIYDFSVENKIKQLGEAIRG